MATGDMVQQALTDGVLDQAIDMYGEVVELTPPTKPLRGRAALGYAHAVVMRCHRARDLHPGITPARASELEVVTSGRLERAEALIREMFTEGAGISTAPRFVELLLADFGLRALAGTLAEARAVADVGMRRASDFEDAVRSGSITAEGARLALAETYLALARVMAVWPPDPAEPDHTETTATVFRSACQTAPDPALSLEGAREWGRWALDRARWADVTEAYGYLESSLLETEQAALPLAEILREASSLMSVATDLAVARSLAGRAEEAIEGLEATRGLLRTAVLYQRHAPQADLSRLRPAVADLTGRMPDATLAFLLPGSVTGVALIARHGQPVQTELLPELTADAVERHMGRFDGALKARRGRTEDQDVIVIGDKGPETLTPQAMLDDVMSWLWSAAMRRVIARADGTSRVVLVPTGLLVTAPLHAAWRLQPDGRRRYVIDDADIVYLPTATMAPDSHPEPLGPASDILVVTEPRPVSARRLEMADRETAAVRRAFPNATVLAHEQATRLAVLDALTAHRLAHLICHGQSDRVAPLNSHLLMGNDEQLRVEDLLARDLSGLRLAVLSACESATASTHLPEAAISLPAALQSAGAGGVLGTLWEADDATTALLMAAFYRNLAAQADAPANPARALRLAQQWVRDSTNAEKTKTFPDMVRQPETTSEGALALWRTARTTSVQWAGFVYSGA
jgi:hypothetical protein